MSCSEDLVRKRVILFPESPFSGEIDSIKLYAAMIRAYSELYGDPSEIITSIKNGCIKISSPMPEVDNSYYIIKPLLPLSKGEKIETVKFKKFKKTTYLSMDVALTALSEGKYTKQVINDALINTLDCFEWEEKPGVSVNRLSMKSTIYYKESLEIKDACNMWLQIEATEKWMNRVISLLRYLGDMGLSKRRSEGYGHFTIVLKDPLLENKASLHVLLSKYIPSQEEINSVPFKEFRYNLTSIGGYARDGSVFGIVRAFTEGTTFPGSIEIGGTVVDYGRYAVVGVPVWI